MSVQKYLYVTEFNGQYGLISSPFSDLESGDKWQKQTILYKIDWSKARGFNEFVDHLNKNLKSAGNKVAKAETSLINYRFNIAFRGGDEDDKYVLMCEAVNKAKELLREMRKDANEQIQSYIKRNILK